MASTFGRIDAPALTAAAGTGTLFTGATSVITNILFSGTATNVDDTNQLDHYLYLQTVNSVGLTTNRLRKIVIPYGGAIDLPRIVLGPNESLVAWCDTAGMIDLGYEVVKLS
ncbi:hypothetical protein [Ralstonia phage RP13]|nr:hypothetical protein [Ralstonia phage RP13]